MSSNKDEKLENHIFIKLRKETRTWDGWDSFIEEVALEYHPDLSPAKNLLYRRSTDSGNCFGQWGEWQDEQAALAFMFPGANIDWTAEFLHVLKTEFALGASLQPLQLDKDGFILIK